MDFQKLCWSLESPISVFCLCRFADGLGLRVAIFSSADSLRFVSSVALEKRISPERKFRHFLHFALPKLRSQKSHRCNLDAKSPASKSSAKSLALEEIATDRFDSGDRPFFPLPADPSPGTLDANGLHDDSATTLRVKNDELEGKIT